VVRWFLGFLMLFAIGGAVAGVITYLRIQPESAAPAAAVRTDVAFIELDPVNVLIPRLDDARETRTYVFVLEASRGSQNLVLQKRLKLRDTYTKYLTVLAERAEGVDPSRVTSLETLENVDYVKRQLQTAANEVIGQNVVYGVLIRSVISNISG
jgi:hypothetical protein